MADKPGLHALVVMPGAVHAPAHDDAKEEDKPADDSSAEYDEFKGACDDMVDALGLDLDDDAKSRFCDAFKHAFELADKAEDAAEGEPEAEKAKDAGEY